MSDATRQQCEVLAPDVQAGDHLYDVLASESFLWPNWTVCPGVVGPFLIVAVKPRPNSDVVELLDQSGAVHLHHARHLLTVRREMSR